MKAIIIFLFLVLIYSCEDYKPVKPFIICEKNVINAGSCSQQFSYTYFDKNGKSFVSYTLTDIYNIGDTIK